MHTLNTSFLQLIVDCNFTIFKKNRDGRFFADSEIFYDSKTSFIVLNPMDLHQELKQLFKILYNLFKKIECPSVFFWVQDESTAFFFNSLFQQILFIPTVTAGTSFPFSKNLRNPYTVFIIFGSPKINYESLVRLKLMNQKTFFLFNFSSLKNKTTFGTYNILTEIDELKKMLFISALLTKTLKKNAYNK